MVNAAYEPLAALEMYQWVDFIETQAEDQHEAIREDFEMKYGPPLRRLFEHIVSMRHMATELERMSSALIDGCDDADPVLTKRLGFKLIEGGKDDLF